MSNKTKVAIVALACAGVLVLVQQASANPFSMAILADDISNIVYGKAPKAQDDNGHGNESDNYDESNPGNSSGSNKGGNNK